MTKVKNCSVLLVSEDKNEVIKHINEIKKCVFFKNVNHEEIREVDFKNENIKDYRAKVYFTTKASKQNVYFSMNLIKPNPITFK